jgi:hypothetical protein
MPKPTFASVTDIQCTCGYLQRSSERPELPIVYDQLTNEFHFTWLSEGGGKPNSLVIYHCPFCGGTAPESKRATLFAVVSDAEAKRLNELLAEVKTPDDAIERLGLPAQDSPTGVSVETPENDGNPPSRRYFRTLTYTNLSDTADVQLTVYRGDRVEITFIGKYVGPD